MSEHWCEICGPKRGFGGHQTSDHEEYAFDDPGAGGVLKLPNGDSLRRHGAGQEGGHHYTLKGPRGGIRHAYVSLWVHGTPARDEEQFLSFLNGDAHDQSKCQVFGAKSKGGRFWDVS